MSTVSMETLRRRALSLGGKVEAPDGAFNTARVQNNAAPVKKPAVLPTPAGPEAPSKEDRTLETIAQMTKIQSKVLLHLREKSLEKPAVREWNFTINRDDKGNMVSIKAVAA